VDIIYRTLENTGLLHDEGPDKDGGVGPYVQSDRQKQGIYLEYAKKLIEKLNFSDCEKLFERLPSGHPMIDLVFDRMESIDPERFEKWLG